MKLTKLKRDHSVAFNITPMIDIVFLLIIFFMTVSQITRVIDQPMPLPQVSNGTTTEPPASVTININKNGQIIVGSKKYTLDKTVQILRDKLQQRENDARQLKIELRCDKRCQSEHVNRIIKELSGLGFTQVRISVSTEN